MIQSIVVLLVLFQSVSGFSPFGGFTRFGLNTNTRASSDYHVCTMKLGEDEKVIVIGVAADSGCGKSTFMRRLTKVFGGADVGPLGGGFDNGGWETNTLVSDMTTVSSIISISNW